MKTFITTALLLLSFNYLSAQGFYTLNADSSKIVIQGTSTVHDWESNVEQMSGSFNGTVTDGALKEISSLNLGIPVESIKSGKGGMDKKTYGALKHDDHPIIGVELSELTQITADSVFADGVITVAGKSVPKQLAAAYQVAADGSISFSGSQPLKMTEFDVDPPKALLGTIKAGDEITIIYDVTFTQ